MSKSDKKPSIFSNPIKIKLFKDEDYTCDNYKDSEEEEFWDYFEDEDFEETGSNLVEQDSIPETLNRPIIESLEDKLGSFGKTAWSLQAKNIKKESEEPLSGLYVTPLIPEKEDIPRNDQGTPLLLVLQLQLNCLPPEIQKTTGSSGVLQVFFDLESMFNTDIEFSKLFYIRLMEDELLKNAVLSEDYIKFRKDNIHNPDYSGLNPFMISINDNSFQDYPHEEDYEALNIELLEEEEYCTEYADLFNIKEIEKGGKKAAHVLKHIAEYCEEQEFQIIDNLENLKRIYQLRNPEPGNKVGGWPDWLQASQQLEGFEFILQIGVEDGLSTDGLGEAFFAGHGNLYLWMNSTNRHDWKMTMD